MKEPRTPEPRPDRDQQPSLAAAGEAAAATHLCQLGYRLVARNLRTRRGEIDLLLRRRRLYIAVEVKTRRSQQAPELSIRPVQLQRLHDSLQALCGSLRPRPRLLRVDIVAVRPLPADKWSILHLPGQEFSPAPRP